MSMNLSNVPKAAIGSFGSGALFDSGGDFASLLASLLDEAGKAFDGDVRTARECVERASALLAGQALVQDSANDGAEAERNGQMAPWQALRVKRYIATNIERNITINELAAATRLSRSYFSKSFRKTFGASPHQFVVDRRIELAKELMVKTETPLCQIALDCGLSDQAHLSRLFRKATGESPNGWRRAHNRVTKTKLLASPSRSQPSNIASAT